jgi:glucose dehydrogenase
MHGAGPPSESGGAISTEQPGIGSGSVRMHGGRCRLVVALVVTLETTLWSIWGVGTPPWRDSLRMSALVAFGGCAT